MIVGVKKVICTCGEDMIRTGGVFGGESLPQDTYYCANCPKYIVVITPKEKEQTGFTQRFNAHHREEEEWS